MEANAARVTWKKRESEIVNFIEHIENIFELKIDFENGNITDKDSTRRKVRFVLNNEIIQAEKIYFDDRQMMIRQSENQRLRKVSLRVIKEILLDDREHIQPEYPRGGHVSG